MISFVFMCIIPYYPVVTTIGRLESIENINGHTAVYIIGTSCKTEDLKTECTDKGYYRGAIEHCQLIRAR